MANWEYRFSRIIKEIQDASLISLQEVDQYEDYLKPELDKVGFETIIHQRSDDDGVYDGVMLGWKKDQFEYLEHMDIKFDDMFARYKMRGKEAFKKSKPGIIALLKHKETGKQIVLTNSHFEWDPKRDFVKYG